MKSYNVNQFRINLRQALNTAEAGTPVSINRHGVKFALVRADQIPEALEMVKNLDSNVAQVDVPRGKAFIDGKEANPAVSVSKVCKHGAAIGNCRHGCKK